MYITERKFISNLRKNFLQNNIPFYTIYDGPDFGTRPFDCFFVRNGKFYAIEAKFQKSFSAFGMKNLRDSQIKNLEIIHKNGGNSFVLLNIWIPNKDNRLLIWKWEEFKEITKKGSIKKQVLVQLPYITKVKGHWPIKEILEFMK